MTPADRRDCWLERAAIMEYDAGMDRKTATERAFKDVYGRKSTHNDLLPLWLTGMEEKT